MRVTKEDVHRLCAETGMDHAQALSLLKQFNGDYRKALRAWQDARSIFIEPVSVQTCDRPLSDYVRQAWRCALKHMRSIHPGMLLLAGGLIAGFIFSRKVGGWIMLASLSLYALPVLFEMISPVGKRIFNRQKRPHARSTF